MKYFKDKWKIIFFLFGYIKRERETKSRKIRKKMGGRLYFTTQNICHKFFDILLKSVVSFVLIFLAANIMSKI